MKKIWILAVTTLLCLTLLTAAGCAAGNNAGPGTAAGSSSTASYQMSHNVTMDETGAYEKEMVDASVGENAYAPAETDRKLTYSAYVDMETQQYRQTLADLAALVDEMQGYIGRSDVQDNGNLREEVVERYASYTLYVPSERLDAFLQRLGELGNVLSTNKQVEDITSPYYDTQSRLDSLREQEQRLLALMDEAEDLDQILQLEDHLSMVRSEMDYLSRMLQVYDREIAMATVELSVREVVEYTPVEPLNRSLWDDIQNAFASSFEFMGEAGRGLLVTLVFLSPYLLIAAVIVVVVLLCVRAARKKKAAQPPYGAPHNGQPPAAPQQTLPEPDNKPDEPRS